MSARIDAWEPDPDMVAEAVAAIRGMFSIERIAAALHARMLEAAATYTEPVQPGDCREDGHLEEAADLHWRVIASWEKRT